MLQIRDIRKVYRTGNLNQVALNNVGIDFRDSEFAAILGPSGSGKTTFLNIIGGLDSYDSGNLIIDGISTKKYKDRDWDTFRNNRVGFVFQSYNLIGHQTVLNNVELALTLSGVDKKTRREKAIDALTKVGLKDHINKLPNQLSGGQMQRVAIARALVNDPEILLADEPTGALDSKTSIDIMNILAEIAKTRLVVMVTHNPDLANEYATRIVTLRDGQIVDDTNPYVPSQDDKKKLSNKIIRKSHMSFLTALQLSFKNLMTKKGRTIMTAFAGSVGIIGIAAILALSNGVNQYIKNVEEDTLSSYPLSVNKTGMDLSAMMNIGSDQDNKNNKSEDKGLDTVVGESKVVNNMVEKMTNNDLTSLKKYIESDSGKSIRNASSYIKYQYNVVPQIFVMDKNKENYRQINPDNSLSSFGISSELYKNSGMSEVMSSNVFSEMTDQSMLYDLYDLKAGSWPTSENECVLVLTDSGKVSDFILYILGLKDYDQFKEMVKSINDEKEVNIVDDNTSFTYRDFLNLEMKIISSSMWYQKDDVYNVWVDKSDDTSFMTNLLNTSGKNLKISGIVQHRAGAKSSPLQQGVIYYQPSLTASIIDESAKSEVVKEQIANSTINVLSGKAFGEDENSNNSFDMQKMFTIDEGAISAAFKFDTSSMNLDTSNINTSFDVSDMKNLPAVDPNQLKALIQGSATISINEQFLAEFVTAMTNDYFAHLSDVIAIAGSGADQSTLIQTYLTLPSAQSLINEYVPKIFGIDEMSNNIGNALSSYMQTYMIQVIDSISSTISSKLSITMQNITKQLSANLQQSFKIDQEAFKSAFKFNMDETQLKDAIIAMMTKQTSSLDNNYAKLNYADFNSPTSISFYATDFDNKQVILDELDSYNNQVSNAGNDNLKITYTDYIGTMMSGVRTIIDMISYMLIAFVSISLIVSSIMIGIITYVSVLERKKEIGILRAIGASKRNISQVFNAETVIEGLISGVMGVAITILICIPASFIVNLLSGIPNIATLPAGAAIALILISIILTLVAGIIPSNSASRKDPVEALRSE